MKTSLGIIQGYRLCKVFRGEGNGNPLQCSCLENPRDGGAWWAAIYGVAQSRTRLKQLSSRLLYLFWPFLPYLGWKDSPGEGDGNPLQCSCLGNPLDRGAWWPTVHGVVKSQTGLNDWALQIYSFTSLVTMSKNHYISSVFHLDSLLSVKPWVTLVFICLWIRRNLGDELDAALPPSCPWNFFFHVELNVRLLWEAVNSTLPPAENSALRAPLLCSACGSCPLILVCVFLRLLAHSCIHLFTHSFIYLGGQHVTSRARHMPTKSRAQAALGHSHSGRSIQCLLSPLQF